MRQGFLLKLDLASSARLAGQRGPGICLPPIPQSWSYRRKPPRLSFVWVLGIQTLVPMLAQPGFAPTRLSLHSVLVPFATQKLQHFMQSHLSILGIISCSSIVISQKTLSMAITLAIFLYKFTYVKLNYFSDFFFDKLIIVI